MKNYFVYIVIIIVFCVGIFNLSINESFNPSTPYDPSLDKSLDFHTYHDKSAKKNAQINDLVGNWFCSSIGSDGETSKCMQAYGKSTSPILKITVNSATGELKAQDLLNNITNKLSINKNGHSFELNGGKLGGGSANLFTSNTIKWKNGMVFKKNNSDGSDVCGANKQYNNVVLSECEADAQYITREIQQQGGLSNNYMLDGYPNTQDFVYNMGSNKLSKDIVPQPQCLCSDELRCLYLPACNDTFIDNCNQVKRRKFVLKKVCKVNDAVTTTIQKNGKNPCSGSELILQTPKIKGNWQGWFYLPSTKLGHVQAIYNKFGHTLYNKDKDGTKATANANSGNPQSPNILCNPYNKSQLSTQNISYPIQNFKLPEIELSQCVDNMHHS
jgi:hypothetical protein